MMRKFGLSGSYNVSCVVQGSVGPIGPKGIQVRKTITMAENYSNVLLYDLLPVQYLIDMTLCEQGDPGVAGHIGVKGDQV